MKILVWAMARALGDGVNHTGYIKQLKKIYPDAQVDLFCTKMHAAAFKNNPYVDNFYYFNTYNKPFSKITRTKIYLNPLMQMKNLIKARKQKYDILVDVDSSYKVSNQFMVKFIMGKDYKKENRLLIGKYRNKYKHKISKEKLLHTYTHVVDENNGSTYTFFQDDFDRIVRDELFITEDKLNKAFNYYTAFNATKKIIFNGEGSDKTISSKKIKSTLLDVLKAYPDYHIFILGYKAYMDKYVEICNELNHCNIHITYETSIEDTFALVKYADLLISVDTALVHIASALNIKVCEILLHGIKDNYPAFPKYVEYEICECDKSLGLDGYSDDDIIKAVSKLIS